MAASERPDVRPLNEQSLNLVQNRLEDSDRGGVDANDPDYELSFRAYSGPILPAEELAAYNRVVPDGAERIMRQFEIESEQARLSRKALVDAHIRSRTLGQCMAFACAMSCFALAGFAIGMNQPWVAAFFGAGTFVTIVVALLKDGGVALPGSDRVDDGN